MDTPTKSQDRAGNWTARGLIAAGRGTALAGLTLAAIGLWAVLLTVVAFAMPLIGSRMMPKCPVFSPVWSFPAIGTAQLGVLSAKSRLAFREAGRTDRGRQERRWGQSLGDSRWRSVAAASKVG